MSQGMRPGSRNLITDVTGLLVGNAQDTQLRSGVTVLTAETPFLASVSVRGGAPGTRETDLLAPGRLVEAVDALILSGGSAFGLEAASGVVSRLHQAGRGYVAGPAKVPIVPAAILFDLANGGDKEWQINPYQELGSAAFDSAGSDFALGTAGAGAGAMTAGLKGGLGSASLVLPSGATVGALVAVNALGSAVVPGERHFWAAPFEIGGEFGDLGPAEKAVPAVVPGLDKRETEAGTNTTIAIVGTDASLDKAAAARLADAAHDGMARALVPAHTPFDGDLVFGVSTGSGPPVDAQMQMALGHAASLCLARAIARAVFEARPEEGDLLPAWCQLAD